MPSSLEEIVTSISDAANSMVEDETWLCLSSNAENPGTSPVRVQRYSEQLRDAVSELARFSPADTCQFDIQAQMPALVVGAKDLCEGMRLLGQYWQMSHREIEAAAMRVCRGYAAIDEFLRMAVEKMGMPVDWFSPRWARIHSARAELLNSLATRFTQRLEEVNASKIA